MEKIIIIQLFITYIAKVSDETWYFRYSLHGIVFSASLWGGPDIDMNWLDGMTGCQGTCNLGESSVTFKNFALVAN